MMKVALASEEDLEAGLKLLGLLDAVSRGYYPTGDDEAEDAPLYFDEDDKDHLAHLWKVLRECLNASPGFQGRVLFGAATLMDPRNEVVNRAADTVELHPRLEHALADVARLNHLLQVLPADGRIEDLQEATTVLDDEQLAAWRLKIDVHMRQAGDGQTVRKGESNETIKLDE